MAGDDQKPKSIAIADGVLKAVALFGVGQYLLATALIHYHCEKAGPAIFAMVTSAIGLGLQLLGVQVFYVTVVDERFFKADRTWRLALKYTIYVCTFAIISFSLMRVAATASFFATFKGCFPDNL